MRLRRRSIRHHAATLVALSAALALAGCHDRPATLDAQGAAATSVATPWDGMKRNEQRARDVQKLVDQQAAQQQQQIAHDTQ